MAVAAGTATEQQAKRNAVEVHSFRRYHDYDFSAVLRVMQSLDPEGYAQVPEFLLTGLKHQRLSNARASAKTQDKIASRLDRIASESMEFGPYADDIMDAALCGMRLFI